MKERPKVGDRIEYESNGVRIGTVIAVAETGVHFTITTPNGFKHKFRKIGLSAIIRILPEEDGNETKTCSGLAEERRASGGVRQRHIC